MSHVKVRKQSTEKHFVSQKEKISYLQSADEVGTFLCHSCLCHHPPQTCSSWKKGSKRDRGNKQIVTIRDQQVTVDNSKDIIETIWNNQNNTETEQDSISRTKILLMKTQDPKPRSYPSLSMWGRCFGVPLRCFLWKWLKSSFSGCTSHPAPLQPRGERTDKKL